MVLVGSATENHSGKSKFFSRSIGSDSSSSSSSSEDEDINSFDEGINENILSESVSELCNKVESLLNVSSITSVRWPSVQTEIEELHKKISPASKVSLDNELIHRLGKIFVQVEDSLQAAKSTFGNAGSAGISAKQASLLASRLPKLKPAIITPSLLNSIRAGSQEEKSHTSSSEYGDSSIDDNDSSEYSTSDSSYSSTESSSDKEDMVLKTKKPSRFFGHGTTSAADKWKKKEPTTETASTQKKHLTRPASRKIDDENILIKTLSSKEEDEEDFLMTSETVMKRYAQILASRGRKGVDRLFQIETLEKLSLFDDIGVIDRIRIKLTLVSFYFEKVPSTTSVTWISMLITLLSEMVQLALENETTLLSNARDTENDNASIVIAGDGSSVLSSLLASIQRLDDEYNQLLLTIPSPTAFTSESTVSHSFEYAELLKLERPLYYLLVKTQYLCHSEVSEKKTCSEAKETLYDFTVRRMAHLYAKSEKGILRMEHGLVPTISTNSANETSLIQDITMNESFSPTTLIEMAGEPGIGLHFKTIPAPLRLATFLLLSDTHHPELLRARALLYLILWIAGENSSFRTVVSHNTSPFLIAKGLFLASCLSDSIMSSDIPTQVLYNRSIAILGLSAFQEGRLRSCMRMLGELVASGRCRELLGQAQGSSLLDDPLRIPTGLLMPWHTWIAIESLEIAFLLASVIVEIPAVVSRTGALSMSTHLNPLPKPLRRLLGERGLIGQGSEPGPGASPKDIIAGVARFILAGDWRRAHSLLSNLKLPSTAANMLTLVKEASLISLLGKNFRSWTSLHIPTFAVFFELDTNRVYELIYNRISEASSLSKNEVSFGAPYLDDRSKEWLYAHEMFSKRTGSEYLSTEQDKYSMWTTGLQIVSAAGILSERLSSLIQENDKLCSKRVNIGGSFSYQKQHSQLASSITKSK